MAKSFDMICSHNRYRVIHRAITNMHRWLSSGGKGNSSLLGRLRYEKIQRYNNSAPYVTPIWLPLKIPPLKFPWWTQICTGWLIGRGKKKPLSMCRTNFLSTLWNDLPALTTNPICNYSLRFHWNMSRDIYLRFHWNMSRDPNMYGVLYSSTCSKHFLCPMKRVHCSSKTSTANNLNPSILLRYKSKFSSKPDHVFMMKLSLELDE